MLRASKVSMDLSVPRVRRLLLPLLAVLLVVSCSGAVPTASPADNLGPSTATRTGARPTPFVSPIASPATVDPSGILTGPLYAGDGWRVLLATHHRWTSPVPPGVSLPGTFFDTNWLDVADSPEAVSRLWSFLDVSDPLLVDTTREVAVALGFLTGVGPICGQLRLDTVRFDGAARLVAVEVEDASNFATLPPASGGISACAAVGNATVIVLALDRSRLPPNPFRLQLDETPHPPGATPIETPVTLRPARSSGPSAIPSAGYALNVADVDGPPITLAIDRNTVAEVSCAGYTTLREGVSGVPGLPWSLDVRQQGGGLLKHFDVLGGQNFVLLVRGLEVSLGEFGSYGPTTAPDACARWSASAQPSR